MDFQKYLEQIVEMLKPMIKKEIEEKVFMPLELKIKASPGQLDDNFGLPALNYVRAKLAAW